MFSECSPPARKLYLTDFRTGKQVQELAGDGQLAQMVVVLDLA